MDSSLVLAGMPALAAVGLAGAAGLTGSLQLAIAAAASGIAAAASLAVVLRLRTRAVEAASMLTELAAAREALVNEAWVERSALTDEGSRLVDETGLFDRTYFEAAFAARVASARRQLQPVTVLLLAVDDETGGPRPVKLVAQILQDTLRDSDAICHLGTGVFGVLLEDTPEGGGVWAAERVRKSLGQRGGPLLRISAGVASYPSHALEADDLMARAEGALEQAQASDRSRVEVASAD